jgi:hypothetical protein
LAISIAGWAVGILRAEPLVDERFGTHDFLSVAIGEPDGRDAADARHLLRSLHPKERDRRIDEYYRQARRVHRILSDIGWRAGLIALVKVLLTAVTIDARRARKIIRDARNKQLADGMARTPATGGAARGAAPGRITKLDCLRTVREMSTRVSKRALFRSQTGAFVFRNHRREAGGIRAPAPANK